MGSSPLTRGKSLSVVPRPRTRRLIPAHAGKMNLIQGFINGIRAHPRSRGENSVGMRGHLPVPGSSPLTRGKFAAAGVPIRLTGLIPAHAGKISRRRSRSLLSGAHPRSRGENGEPVTTALPKPGSSPLTRGKYRRFMPSMVRSGLIPAHAGKINQVIGRYGTVWAHPRSRGENAVMTVRFVPRSGSSPLTRGKC